MRAVLAGQLGPGVDLRGDDARRVIAAAEPMLEWLSAREPGVDVRSISVNDTRVLVSLSAEPKPRALRIEAPDLREAGAAAEALIVALSVRALDRRLKPA